MGWSISKLMQVGVVALSLAIGSTSSAFAQAGYTRRECFSVQRHTASPMEPRGLLAEWDTEQQRLTVSGAAKVAFANRRTLARMLGLPEQSVRMVFDLGAQRRYDEAAALRTARLQAADPVARSFRERFGKDGVTLVQDRLVALDPVHGRATVAVVWTERAGGQTQRLSGQVFLVSSRSGWRWDGASFV